MGAERFSPKHMLMKRVCFLFFMLLTSAAYGQNPCGTVLFGSEVSTSLYPATFFNDILNTSSSPCVFVSNPAYELNAITLDEADLIPCAGDTLSGLWVEAPNHEPLCVYTWPPNAVSVLGAEFMGDLLVGAQPFFIAIVGVPIGGGTIDNFISTGYIPVNPNYSDTLELFTCDPALHDQYITDHFLSQCGCDSLVTRHFIYEELTPAIDGPMNICLGDTVSLGATINASGDFQYLWSTGDTTQSIQAFLEDWYSVTITVGPDCFYSTTHFLGFHPIPNVWIEAPEGVCLGEEYQLVEDLWEGQHQWTLPDSSIVFGSTVNLIATESLSGVYHLTVVDANDCVINDSVFIQVGLPVPLPDFPDMEACDGDTLAVYYEPALTDTRTFYEWVNGRGHSYELNHLWFIKRNWRGENLIRATTDGGCVSEKPFHLEVNRCKTRCDSILLFFPNALTPNGDGSNDKFIIGGNCEVYLVSDLYIYNRWGGLVFEQHDYCPQDHTKAWDGTVGGALAESGVYTWMARITDNVTGKECLRSGSITLVISD